MNKHIVKHTVPTNAQAYYCETYRMHRLSPQKHIVKHIGSQKQTSTFHSTVKEIGRMAFSECYLIMNPFRLAAIDPVGSAPCQMNPVKMPPEIRPEFTTLLFENFRTLRTRKKIRESITPQRPRSILGSHTGTAPLTSPRQRERPCRICHAGFQRWRSSRHAEQNKHTHI